MGARQDVSATIESQAVVEWEAQASTGGSGVSITRYILAVDGRMTQNVSHHDGRDVFTANITELDYNTIHSYTVWL